MDANTAALLRLANAAPQVRAALADAEALAEMLETLVLARKAAGLSVDELARRMDATAAEVLDFERLGGDPRLVTAYRYTRAIGCCLEVRVRIDG
jgi:ribosome-binding protein aMBF1 (putative translation factor)